MFPRVDEFWFVRFSIMKNPFFKPHHRIFSWLFFISKCSAAISMVENNSNSWFQAFPISSINYTHFYSSNPFFIYQYLHQLIIYIINWWSLWRRDSDLSELKLCRYDGSTLDMSRCQPSKRLSIQILFPFLGLDPAKKLEDFISYHGWIYRREAWNY